MLKLVVAGAASFAAASSVSGPASNWALYSELEETIRRNATKPTLGSGSCTTGVNTYDFFLLVTQWPTSLCSDGTFSCSNNDQWFTMHGLWPNDNDGDYPCFCSTTAFDPNAISTIQSNMNQYWPSLNGADSDFWSHEWSKHGTCASDVFPDELSFFSGALKARQMFDITTALQAHGITPSNSNAFPLSSFHSALQSSYGATGVVTCDSNGMITTVIQCVSKQLGAMACPDNLADNCDASSVTLPATITTDDTPPTF